jgi:hypothetical protein
MRPPCIANAVNSYLCDFRNHEPEEKIEGFIDYVNNNFKYVIRCGKYRQHPDYPEIQRISLKHTNCIIKRYVAEDDSIIYIKIQTNPQSDPMEYDMFTHIGLRYFYDTTWIGCSETREPGPGMDRFSDVYTCLPVIESDKKTKTTHVRKALILKPLQNSMTLSDLVKAGEMNSTLTNKLVEFCEVMIELGRQIGFAHNDMHIDNILFDNDKEQFVLIDFGRSYVHFEYLQERDALLSLDPLSDELDNVCAKLSQATASSSPRITYKNVYQIVEHNSLYFKNYYVEKYAPQDSSNTSQFKHWIRKNLICLDLAGMWLSVHSGGLCSEDGLDAFIMDLDGKVFINRGNDLEVDVPILMNLLLHTDPEPMERIKLWLILYLAASSPIVSIERSEKDSDDESLSRWSAYTNQHFQSVHEPVKKVYIELKNILSLESPTSACLYIRGQQNMFELPLLDVLYAWYRRYQNPNSNSNRHSISVGGYSRVNPFIQKPSFVNNVKYNKLPKLRPQIPMSGSRIAEYYNSDFKPIKSRSIEPIEKWRERVKNIAARYRQQTMGRTGTNELSRGGKSMPKNRASLITKRADKLTPSGRHIMIGSRKHVIYLGPKGGEYVKRQGDIIPLKKVKTRKTC